MSESENLINKYSFGVGDRFAHQAKAQLQAFKLAKKSGVSITPVWNKSFREHQNIGSSANQTREQADSAVKMLDWQDSYLVDADHINLSNVDFFMDSCDFFTIDVADYIGSSAQIEHINSYINSNKQFVGWLTLPHLGTRVEITEVLLQSVAEKYLFAVQEAGRIYRHIVSNKGGKPFVVEVSMDETDEPQTPVELFLIFAALAKENIPLQTIAPKFSGRFNKGVDYVGDLGKFKQEFEQDIAVIKQAVTEFNLPKSLKLSIHSGSDKFSIYSTIREAIRKFDAGLHLKTAGTTWLEELIGLAEAGRGGLEIANKIYKHSLLHFEELCAQYSAVIDIDPQKLPSVETVKGWDSQQFTSSLRHDQSNNIYNPHFRQLLHIGYKLAAKMGDRYLQALKNNDTIIAKNVTENIFKRHIKPLFF
jgi:hypothetical protein